MAALINPEALNFLEACVPVFTPFTKPISFNFFGADFTLNCVTWSVLLAFIAILLFVQNIDGIKNVFGGNG